MILLNFESTVLVDIDETLVCWSKTYRKPGKGKIAFVDPYTKETVYLTPHKPHIRLVKQWKGRGFGIVVHSMAGVQWANTVLRVLELTKYVDVVMSKATRHLDDKEDIAEICGTRVYLKNT